MMIWHASIWFHGRRLPWFSESRRIQQIPARMGLYIESRLGMCHILRHTTTSGFDDRSWIDWLSDTSYSVYHICTWLHTAIHTCTLYHTREEEASQRIYWNWKGSIANTPILGLFESSTFIDIILEISASRYVHLLTLISFWVLSVSSTSLYTNIPFQSQPIYMLTHV
jgi:hypothetical protein